MIPLARWVAPFGDPRINGRSPLPSAFRSVPRPSSPLGAKASTRCPSRAAPAPSPKHAASPRAEGSTQRAEGRSRAACCLLTAAFWSRCASTAPPMLAHRPHAYPCSRPDRPRGMAGPASRSRLASRCHKSRSPRTDARPQARPAGARTPSDRRLLNAIPTATTDARGQKTRRAQAPTLGPDPGAV
jgi:hypothetical protein